MRVDYRIGLKKTALLKMHIYYLPVGGALEHPKYSGFPSNGCKQISSQLINYIVSGKMKIKNHQNFSEDNQTIRENEKSVKKI